MMVLFPKKNRAACISQAVASPDATTASGKTKMEYVQQTSPVSDTNPSKKLSN
ncbi:MAG: hypothetical protein Q9M92_05160 [Enterobacterales bacterium]|nr:hypothetical protein [Enterobacterales bacterium]